LLRTPGRPYLTPPDDSSLKDISQKGQVRIYVTEKYLLMAENDSKPKAFAESTQD
jgi:hypothetical protein